MRLLKILWIEILKFISQTYHFGVFTDDVSDFFVFPLREPDGMMLIVSEDNYRYITQKDMKLSPMQTKERVILDREILQKNLHSSDFTVSLRLWLEITEN